jgi:Pentapeptide repeats (9 copies)
MADERPKLISQPWFWALAGAALVFVFAFVFVIVWAPSLLIHAPKAGLSAADELKARNDVRGTLVQALAGLAVAGGLVVTYRTYQQNRMEQERTYQQHRQEQDRTRQEQDRTYERELYAKAVEQLGHEKAAVRLGALYSLERLAGDKPERRQIIVDVICAYLRMPFSPGPAIKPEPEDAEAPDVPAAGTERWPAGTGDTWQQEKQVRLTAQHILADHLRDDRTTEQRSTDPPGPHFWPDIRLNLTGATLIDFNLQNGVVAGADFRLATFAGAAWFGGAEFTDSAEFGGATFAGDAGFGGAAFAGAGFGGANFTGRPDFGRATFTGNVWFDELSSLATPGSAWRPSWLAPRSARRTSPATPCSSGRRSPGPLSSIGRNSHTEPGSSGRPSPATPSLAGRSSAAPPSSSGRPSKAPPSSGRSSQITPGSTWLPSPATPSSAVRRSSAKWVASPSGNHESHQSRPCASGRRE